MNLTEHLQDNKYVAFLDVLGFKQLVKEKGQRLNTYFDTITDTLQELSQKKQNINSLLVSDSTILACPLDNDNLRLLFTAIQTIQSRCAEQNIWIRGAVSIGDIHFNRQINIVVGNGLINAYLLEAQEKFPRVIIDPRIIRNTFGIKEEFLQFFNHDRVGPGGLPNLVPLVHPYYHENRIEQGVLFIAFAERIAQRGKDNLDKIYDNLKEEIYREHSNYSKYRWLKDYFIDVMMHYRFHLAQPPFSSNVDQWYNDYIVKLNAL